MAKRTHRSKRQTMRARGLRRDVSDVERKLWPRLRNSLLGVPFRRQHPVGRRYLDYVCVPLKLAVEVDGPLHSLARDATRDAELKALGIDVMHFSDQEVRDNLDGVVATIKHEIWLLQNR